MWRDKGSSRMCCRTWQVVTYCREKWLSAWETIYFWERAQEEETSTTVLIFEQGEGNIWKMISVRFSWIFSNRMWRYYLDRGWSKICSWAAKSNHQSRWSWRLQERIHTGQTIPTSKGSFYNENCELLQFSRVEVSFFRISQFCPIARTQKAQKTLFYFFKV